MFNRTSRLVADCVKCRIRIAGLNRSWEPHSVSTPHSSGQRWQSAIAIQVDEDDHTSHSTNNNPQSDTNNELQTQAREINDFRPDKQRQSGKGTKYRRWQPHQAEELGMSVLGRPAEVLILPTRKRKIARPVPEEVEGLEKGGIQESLDSELKPVSMVDVLKNIDSLKLEMGRDRNRFSTSEWKDHRKRLSDGFTKSQLQEYLRIAAGKSISDPREGYMPAKDQKRSMAAKIMNDVWKWTSRDEDDVTVESQPKPVQKTMVINAAKLDYIMLYEKQQLASISETFDVQIDVFKKKSRMQLSGTRPAVENANVRLSRIVKSVQALSLQIPKSLQGLLGDNTKSDGLLMMLMQKHKLVIQRNRDALNVVGPTKTHIDVIIRDMVLLSGKAHERIPSSFHPNQIEETAVRALFSSDDLPQWLRQDRKWYRNISSRTQTRTDDEASISSTRELRKLTSKLLKADKPDQNQLSRYTMVPGSLTHEYTASIGQTLFNQAPPSSSSDKDLAKSQPDTGSIFVSQQALLPQILSRKEFTLVVKSGDHEAKAEEQPSQPFLLYLRLRPVTEADVSPRLEIVLSGQDANLGLRQHMQIQQVQVILDEWQHSILLPHQPADILLSRQSKINLIGNNKVQPSEAYLNILRQVGSYLEQVRVASQVELPSVWKIDISPLLKIRSMEQKREDDNVESTTHEEHNVTGGEQASPKSVLMAKTMSSYILEPPEYMDVSCYSSPVTGDRYIDHIVCDTEPLERPRSRHILRIVRDSLSNLAPNNDVTLTNSSNTVQQQKWFKESVAAAYSLIAAFGDASKSASQVGQRSPARS